MIFPNAMDVILGWTLLVQVGFYRISDIVLGVISNVFYQDLGFSKTAIANAVKMFGLLMTIVGGFIGGILAIRRRHKIIPWGSAVIGNQFVICCVWRKQVRRILIFFI